MVKYVSLGAHMGSSIILNVIFSLIKLIKEMDE